MSQQTKSLTGLPAEILLDIFQNLDVNSIFRLTTVNRMINSFIEANKATILLPILEVEFSPFGELLHLCTASEEDLWVPGATYQPRKVVFKGSPLDLRGITLTAGGFPSPDSAAKLFKQVSRGNRTRNAMSLPAAKTVTIIGNNKIKEILGYCRVVRKWEELFPQFRWIHMPADCRWLNDNEKIRLRRAIYRWWLYATYFHGDMPRPRRGQPEAFVDDIRVSHIRMLPTAEVLELEDLVATIKWAIRYYFCPWFGQCLGISTDFNDDVSASISGPAQQPDSRWARIINTYAKLDPKELLFYYERLYSFPLTRLMSDVRIRHPTFCRDQESLGSAIAAVLDERLQGGNFEQPTSAMASAGGILDWGNERDDQRRVFGNDGSHDGSLPAPDVYVQPALDYTYPGDDGTSFVEERSDFAGGQPFRRWVNRA